MSKWQLDGEDPGTAEKYNFAPGVPADASIIPVLRYQAVLGKVFVIQRWPDESTARGEIPLAELEALIGGPAREGWYNALGEYLGATWAFQEASE